MSPRAVAALGAAASPAPAAPDLSGAKARVRSDNTQLNIWVPVSFSRWLKRVAEAEKRTQGAQLEWFLEKLFGGPVWLDGPTSRGPSSPASPALSRVPAGAATAEGVQVLAGTGCIVQDDEGPCTRPSTGPDAYYCAKHTPASPAPSGAPPYSEGLRIDPAAPSLYLEFPPAVRSQQLPMPTSPCARCGQFDHSRADHPWRSPFAVPSPSAAAPTTGGESPLSKGDVARAILENGREPEPAASKPVRLAALSKKEREAEKARRAERVVVSIDGGPDQEMTVGEFEALRDARETAIARVTRGDSSAKPLELTLTTDPATHEPRVVPSSLQVQPPQGLEVKVQRGDSYVPAALPTAIFAPSEHPHYETPAAPAVHTSGQLRTFTQDPRDDLRGRCHHLLNGSACAAPALPGERLCATHLAKYGPRAVANIIAARAEAQGCTCDERCASAGMDAPCDCGCTFCPTIPPEGQVLLPDGTTARPGVGAREAADIAMLAAYPADAPFTCAACDAVMPATEAAEHVRAHDAVRNAPRGCSFVTAAGVDCGRPRTSGAYCEEHRPPVGISIPKAPFPGVDMSDPKLLDGRTLELTLGSKEPAVIKDADGKVIQTLPPSFAPPGVRHLPTRAKPASVVQVPTDVGAVLGAAEQLGLQTTLPIIGQSVELQDQSGHTIGTVTSLEPGVFADPAVTSMVTLVTVTPDEPVKKLRRKKPPYIAAAKDGAPVYCAICGEPQFWTDSGISCSGGHGGAPSVLARAGSSGTVSGEAAPSSPCAIAPVAPAAKPDPIAHPPRIQSASTDMLRPSPASAPTPEDRGRAACRGPHGGFAYALKVVATGIELTDADGVVEILPPNGGRLDAAPGPETWTLDSLAAIAPGAPLFCHPAPDAAGVALTLAAGVDQASGFVATVAASYPNLPVCVVHVSRLWHQGGAPPVTPTRGAA